MLAIIEQQPEWRNRLKKALFPNLDIEKALQDLAETVLILREMLERMDARLVNVERDVAVLKSDVAVLKSDVAVLKSDVAVLKSDVRDLKGNSQEQKYRNMATGLFGRYLKNGQDVTNRVADDLYAALEAGTISDAELTQVLAADLLWGGELRQSKEPAVLVMEASWLAESHDVERAALRSQILRRIGVNAFAVVGGREWTDEATKLATQARVIVTSNGRINPSSWESAMTQV